MNKRVFDVHDAAEIFAQLVDEAAEGREVILVKAGEPIARLVPLDAPTRGKNLGLLQGKIDVADDFNAPRS